MRLASAVWMRTADEWQTTLSDTSGRMWQATLQRSGGSLCGEIAAAALYVARSGNGAPIGGHYTIRKGFATFADAENWIYAMLEKL